jgi:hypothetical protein
LSGSERTAEWRICRARRRQPNRRMRRILDLGHRHEPAEPFLKVEVF